MIEMLRNHRSLTKKEAKEFVLRELEEVQLPAERVYES